MKKIILFLSILFCAFLQSFSQENYNWTVIDSVAKTKAVLYNDTKVFIAKTWESGKAVTQIDDKESGHILIKGIAKVPAKVMGSVSFYILYSYIIDFKFKDNKYKFVLNEVAYDSYISTDNLWSGYLKLPTKKENPLKLYDNLMAELQRIVDLYISDIKKENKNTDNW